MALLLLPLVLSMILSGPLSTAPAPQGASPVATSWSITTQPSSTATSGSQIIRQPVVRILDQFGAPFTLSGVNCTVAINSGTSTISGTTTQVTDTSGIATFTDLTLTGVSTDTLKFTGGGLTQAVSTSVLVSGSGFATPDLMFSDWHGTTIENSGLLANGNQWTTDTPGHTNDVPQANPTGIKPWSASLANKVVVITYDAATDSNAGILVLPGLANTPFKMGYGSTHYISFWIYLTSTATIGTILRKWFYERWNSGHGSSGDPDHVCRGFGAQIGGETDQTTGTAWPWNSNTANSLITKQNWIYIEAKTVCDTSPGSGDGKITLWVNDANTPILQDVTIHMSTASSPSGAAWFMDWVRIGAQLELGTTGEQRYLGPCAMSTQRIGPL